MFCGSGSTAAIDKLIRLLDLDRPRAERPVVFIGPYEHHSNELPWRESERRRRHDREDDDGRIDLAHLAAELRRHADRPLKLGSFSAASNVTGIVSDVDAIAQLLHRHGALACFDYAAAGPYLRSTWRPRTPSSSRRTSSWAAPGRPACWSPSARSWQARAVGAGRRDDRVRQPDAARRYHPEPAVREEAGTPAIVESIRAGLVFALKEAVGADEIHRREDAFARRALASWGENPNLRILGNPELERLAIVSFGVRHPRGLLHANFVVARAQRPVRDPGAQRLLLRRPVHPPHLPDRRRLVGGDARRRGARPRSARSSRSRASASTTSSARRSSTTSSRRST